MASQADVTLRNAWCDAITTRVGNAGLLRIYTGSVPSNCAQGASGTKLSEHTCGSPFAPAAGTPTPGQLAVTLPANVNALADGTAGYYRIYKSDGTTCVWQNSVVSSGSGLVLNPSSNVIASGQPVAVTSWTITAPGA